MFVKALLLDIYFYNININLSTGMSICRIFAFFCELNSKKCDCCFCELQPILPKNQVNFAISPRTFRVTSFPAVGQKDLSVRDVITLQDAIKCRVS